MLPSGRSMTWRKVFERQWAPRRGGGGAAVGRGEAHHTARRAVPCGAPFCGLSAIIKSGASLRRGSGSFAYFT